MRPVLLALCLVFALVGCGESERTAETGALKLGQPAKLVRGGVDTRLTAEIVTDPYVPEGPRAPAGQHYVGISLKWIDRRDPFPRAWARFELIDDKGGRTTGAVLSPLKRTFPDKPARGRPQTQVVALPIADGREPRLLKLSSIVARWPFSAHWAL